MIRRAALAATLTLAASACTPGEAIWVAFHPHGGNVVDQANRVAWVESRHQPQARNPRSSACGLFQLLALHQPRAERLGFTRHEVCTDPLANALVAADLYRECGWRPWSPPSFGCVAP